jgi:hypothetical protein
VLEVPPFPALGGPQVLRPLGAGRADAGQGRPARDEHLFHLPGRLIDTAELDRPQACAVVFGHGPHRIPGRRVGHPVSPGRPPSGRHRRAPASIDRGCGTVTPGSVA